MGNYQVCECEEIQNQFEFKSNKSKNNSRKIYWGKENHVNLQTHTFPTIKTIQQGLFQVSYPDGGIYRGQMQNNLRHGVGRHTWLTGSFYQGYWLDDKGSGLGKLKNQMFQLTGYFKDNTVVTGKMISLKTKRQEIYEGQFSKFMYHGKGTLTIVKDSIYVGQFANNKKEGNGKLVFNNGHQYEGEFINGRMEGNGVYKTPEFEYAGQFKNGKMCGQGKCVWKNGAIYIGNYQNGVKEGYGQYIYEDGQTYQGIWKRGKPFQLSYTFGKNR